MSEFVLATRGSALALWQTRHVAKLLGAPSRERVIETRGDIDGRSILAGKLEKGFFTKELEEALLGETADFAVHSLKDLPTANPPGLVVGAVLEREDPADLLVVRPDAHDPAGDQVLPVKPGAKVGASSLRRMALIKTYGRSLEAAPLRGNVPTRVRKLGNGDYGAIVLAAAGLKRLEIDLSAFKVFRLDPTVWLPAPGQGAVAVQCRARDEKGLEVLARIQHAETRRAVERERLLLQAFEGGCSAPFGCYAQGDALRVGFERDGRWGATQLSLPQDLDFARAKQTIDSLVSLEPFHAPFIQPK